MSKHLVRLICALVLVTTFAGCKATGLDGVRKKKSESKLPDPTSGTPGQSPFLPYPT